MDLIYANISCIFQQAKRKRPELSRSDKKALTSIRLVEKLERIGIDTIMASTYGSSFSPLVLQGSLYARHGSVSPMAQLTFLRNSMSGNQEKLSPSSTASDSSTTKRNIIDKKQDESIPNRESRQRRTSTRAMRSDLGQVVTSAAAPVTSAKETPPAQSALGSISSLLFGRKGGLL